MARVLLPPLGTTSQVRGLPETELGCVLIFEEKRPTLRIISIACDPSRANYRHAVWGLCPTGVLIYMEGDNNEGLVHVGGPTIATHTRSHELHASPIAPVTIMRLANSYPVEKSVREPTLGVQSHSVHGRGIRSSKSEDQREQVHIEFWWSRLRPRVPAASNKRYDQLGAISTRRPAAFAREISAFSWSAAQRLWIRGGDYSVLEEGRSGQLLSQLTGAHVSGLSTGGG